LVVEIGTFCADFHQVSATADAASVTSKKATVRKRAVALMARVPQSMRSWQVQLERSGRQTAFVVEIDERAIGPCVAHARNCEY
jgi:hypothetical protein